MLIDESQNIEYKEAWHDEYPGFIETWGRGIGKICEALQKVGLKTPTIEDSCGGTLFTIYRKEIMDDPINGPVNEPTYGPVNDPLKNSQNVDNENVSGDDTKGDTKDEPTNEPTCGPINGPVNGPVNCNLTDRQIAMIEIMEKTPTINRTELLGILNVSLTTLRREISSLKASGYIKREGSDKSGLWLVLKHPNGPMSV